MNRYTHKTLSKQFPSVPTSLANDLLDLRISYNSSLTGWCDIITSPRSTNNNLQMCFVLRLEESRRALLPKCRCGGNQISKSSLLGGFNNSLANFEDRPYFCYSISCLKWRVRDLLHVDIIYTIINIDIYNIYIIHLDISGYRVLQKARWAARPFSFSFIWSLG